MDENLMTWGRIRKPRGSLMLQLRETRKDNKQTIYQAWQQIPSACTLQLCVPLPVPKKTINMYKYIVQSLLLSIIIIIRGNSLKDFSCLYGRKCQNIVIFWVLLCVSIWNRQGINNWIKLGKKKKKKKMMDYIYQNLTLTLQLEHRRTMVAKHPWESY